MGTNDFFQLLQNLTYFQESRLLKNFCDFQKTSVTFKKLPRLLRNFCNFGKTFVTLKKLLRLMKKILRLLKKFCDLHKTSQWEFCVASNCFIRSSHGISATQLLKFWHFSSTCHDGQKPMQLLKSLLINFCDFWKTFVIFKRTSAIFGKLLRLFKKFCDFKTTSVIFRKLLRLWKNFCDFWKTSAEVEIFNFCDPKIKSP